MTYKTIEEYLQLPYTIQVTYDNSPDDPGWVARVLELPGCITQADTFEELGEMIEDAMRAWIEASMEDGDSIPEPRPVEDYSGKFVARVPRSLHRDLVQAAEQDGVSLNTFVTVALGRAVGQPMLGQPIPQPQEAANADTHLPSPHWPRLSPAAYRALLVAGLQVEAEQTNEQLLASWIEGQLSQARASLTTGHIQDALFHVQKVNQVVAFCGRASPLMAAFAQTAEMLTQQIKQVSELQSGIIEQVRLQARINIQAQAVAAQKPAALDDLFFRTAGRQEGSRVLRERTEKRSVYDILKSEK